MELTDNKYFKYIFSSDWDKDMMIALLTNFPFNSFEETDSGVIGYLPSSKVSDLLEEEILDFADKYKIKVIKEVIENKNWNQEWETAYKPVRINKFCLIRADFHDIDISGFEHVITVNPEMTFGTGHHETTVMMIKLMSEIKFNGLKVLDFGSGTGILAILAEKMGAAKVLALDNDPVSVKNISENASKNNCSAIKSKHADTLNIKKFSKDIVLANIDRNVLTIEAENISNSLHKGGFLLISGILVKDRDLMVDLFEGYSLKHMKTLEEGEWTALKFIAY
ncbi:MAG: 50S ribosomal protein L11 methyltransferase [Saprospiraceae bacterium]|nr:50S ribosomal protein L11 methyltransferase [Saprospiraceae bacterium]